MVVRVKMFIAFLLFVIKTEWCQCEQMTCLKPFALNSYVCSCYYFGDDDRLTWLEGRDRCTSLGGDLLVIDSSEEEDQIAWRIRNSINRTNPRDKVQKWWIGLHRTSERWQWVDGSPGNIERVLWHFGQPDLPKQRDVCVEFRHTLLNDVDCSQQRNIICESKPVRELGTGPTPSWTTSRTSEETTNEGDSKGNAYIFPAIIGGLALLALIAVLAVICLAVRVRRLRRMYQSSVRQSSFHVETRDLGGRPQLTLPRSEPGLRQISMNPHGYAEPMAEPHPGYEKLRHSNTSYLEVLHQ